MWSVALTPEQVADQTHLSKSASGSYEVAFICKRLKLNHEKLPDEEKK